MKRQFSEPRRRIPKIHWNGWITQENFDWLCHTARLEERSIANLINKIVKAVRENGHQESSTK